MVDRLREHGIRFELHVAFAQQAILLEWRQETRRRCGVGLAKLGEVAPRQLDLTARRMHAR